MRNSDAKSGSLGRRSRMRATSTGKRVTLQPRDWLWLQKLHQHGPLASSFLLTYAKHLGKSEKRAKERLGDLFHEDNTVHGGPYLTRPPQQFLTIDSRYNQLVYGLSKAGERALKENGLWRPANASASGPWLHSFMVSSITASIELAVNERDDLGFIPQADILERAETVLSYPVEIVDPATKRKVTKALKPDALFGLEYISDKESRFRFFVVEADRATEPLTSSNFNRKSALRGFSQYQAYVSGRAYKEHLKLTAPLLVLNIYNNETRIERTLDLLKRQHPQINSYMLFQAWENFETPFRPPLPNAGLLNGSWARVGELALSIDNEQSHMQ